jgi:hypothetical protein
LPCALTVTLLAACNGPDKVEPGPLAPHFDADDDGFVAADDCDDSDASVFPGATDVPGDGVDQDCDGRDRHALVPTPPIEYLRRLIERPDIEHHAEMATGPIASSATATINVSETGNSLTP